jgi:hypothetical protein
MWQTSIATRLAFVTTHTPLCRVGMARMKHTFPKNGSKIFETRLRSEHNVEYAHEILFFVSTVPPSRNDATPQHN